MEPDLTIQYDAGKLNFRITDGVDYSESSPAAGDGDGLAIVALGGDDEDGDDVYLVATHLYTGTDFEPDTVYDISACETAIEEDVDLSTEPEASVEDDEGEEE